MSDNALLNSSHTLRFFNHAFAQVVEDFAAENVVYLELRTTPKVLYVWQILLTIQHIMFFIKQFLAAKQGEGNDQAFLRGSSY